MASDIAPQQDDFATTIPTTPRKGAQSSLPPEKVFPIQIGTELFRLSGASIMSDAPSYFSQFFEEQLRQNGDTTNLRTLYIDRDPTTFQEIARHLQGYHVRPKDGSQFVKLFADSQFYSLPRLMSQLFESEIFIQIGERHFQIPRDIFSSPGDSPNFFSLGFAIFFASPSEVFPGLDRKGLLRPPAIIPPSVPNRSGEVFAELIHLLRGYPLHIRNDAHRAELLRDCRYFHLRGLEQKLIPHHISFNPVLQRSEIVIRLEDVRQSGLQTSTEDTETGVSGGSVAYARPFVDEQSYDVIVEIGSESTIIDRSTMRAEFLGLTKARVTSLFQVLINKMNLSSEKVTPEGSFRICIDDESDVTVDGDIKNNASADQTDVSGPPPAKRKRTDDPDGQRWIVRNGQWRLRIERTSTGRFEMVFTAVKVDAYTDQRIRNRTRTFLC